MSKPLKLGISRAFQDGDGRLKHDIGIELIADDPRVDFEFVSLSPEAKPDEIRDFDVIMTTVSARFTRASFEGVDRLTSIAKFGVGYDNIDTDACTDKDILVFITPEGVVRPVAVAILTYILALSTRIFAKDKLVRTGRWHDKPNHMGLGLAGKVVGSIGLGRIAREFFRIAQPLEIVPLATDPLVSPDEARALGIRMVDLPTLLAESDFVCINCPLTDSTRHLIGAGELAAMKSSAFLINTARGEIVDQNALTHALQEKQIQGAALDVFETEPLPPDDPLAALENVILAPHGLAWTNELFRGNGEGCMRRILKLAAGEVPQSVVNPSVLEHAGMSRKIEQFA